jgi:hypothetical protein
VAKLWAQLGNMLSGIRAALRSFVRALLNGPSGSPRALPAASSQPPPELRAANDSSKVSLIVVNPYLVHAYWDVDPSRLPPGTKSAVLRFHDVSETAPGPPFDVDIDLRAPNWYVHLWSPAKSYYADLAVKTEDGEFIPLATSNHVETPRAWPAAEAQKPAEVKVVGQALSPAGRQRRPPGGVGRLTDGAEAHFQAPAPETERIAVGSTIAPALPPPAATPRPLHADEVLRQRLAQIYALRSVEPRPAKAMVAAGSGEASGEVFISRGAESPAAAALSPIPSDLTALAEHQFSPGLPSSQLGDPLPAP